MKIITSCTPTCLTIMQCFFVFCFLLSVLLSQVSSTCTSLSIPAPVHPAVKIKLFSILGYAAS